jgi:hypothetical protein
MVGLAAGYGIDEKSGVAAGEGTADHEGDGVGLLAAATDADGTACGVGPNANAVVASATIRVAAEAVRTDLANIEICVPPSILKSAECRVNYAVKNRSIQSWRVAPRGSR